MSVVYCETPFSKFICDDRLLADAETLCHIAHAVDFFQQIVSIAVGFDHFITISPKTDRFRKGVSEIEFLSESIDRLNSALSKIGSFEKIIFKCCSSKGRWHAHGFCSLKKDHIDSLEPRGVLEKQAAAKFFPSGYSVVVNQITDPMDVVSYLLSEKNFNTSLFKRKSFHWYQPGQNLSLPPHFVDAFDVVKAHINGKISSKFLKNYLGKISLYFKQIDSRFVPFDANYDASSFNKIKVSSIHNKNSLFINEDNHNDNKSLITDNNLNEIIDLISNPKAMQAIINIAYSTRKVSQVLLPYDETQHDQNMKSAQQILENIGADVDADLKIYEEDYALEQKAIDSIIFENRSEGGFEKELTAKKIERRKLDLKNGFKPPYRLK